MWRKTKRKYTEIEESKRWDETEQNERTVFWTMRVKMRSNDLINIIVYIPSILFVLTLYIICMHLFVYVWKEVIESKWDWLFTTGYSSQRRRIVNSCHKRKPNSYVRPYQNTRHYGICNRDAIYEALCINYMKALHGFQA